MDVVIVLLLLTLNIYLSIGAYRSDENIFKLNNKGIKLMD